MFYRNLIASVALIGAHLFRCSSAALPTKPDSIRFSYNAVGGVSAQTDPLDPPTASCVGKHWSACTFLRNYHADEPVTSLEESNLLSCAQMIKEVMLTGATQPGLNVVASEMYHIANPGPYPFSFSLGSNESDYLDDLRLVHPFLPDHTVSTTLEELSGSDGQKQLYAQGFQNASRLAVSTCCEGELFGFALPFSQSGSDADETTELQSSLRYYVAMSGKLNQTDKIWYTVGIYLVRRALPCLGSLTGAMRFARSRRVPTRASPSIPGLTPTSRRWRRS